MNAWSEAMDSALRAAWGAGLGAVQIGALLGVTDAAVRYRRRRLGLKARGSAEQQFGGVHKVGPSVYKPRTPPPTMDRLGPTSEPKPLEARAWDECAFPVGQGAEGLICCGGLVPRGSRRPYCGFHLILTAAKEERRHANERAA